jgi:hypothetical protein
MKLAIAACAVLLFTGGAIIVLVARLRSSVSEVPSTPPPSSTKGPLLSSFDSIYRLYPGESVVRVDPSDYPADREAYAGQELAPNWTMGFRWDEGRKKATRWSIAGGDRTLLSVLGELGIEDQTIEASEEVRSLHLPGDWVVRRSTSDAELAAYAEAAVAIFAQQLNLSIKLTSREQDHEVIVVRGQLTNDRASPIRIVGPQRPGIRDIVSLSAGRRTEPLDALLSNLANRLNRRFINEAISGSTLVNCEYMQSFDIGNELQTDRGLADGLLASISQQSGLRFTRERRIIRMWSLEGTAPTLPAATKQSSAVAMPHS